MINDDTTNEQIFHILYLGYDITYSNDSDILINAKIAEFNSLGGTTQQNFM